MYILRIAGSFPTAQEAHEAYMAAKSFFDPEAAEKLVSRMKRVRKYKYGFCLSERMYAHPYAHGLLLQRRNI